MQRKCAVILSCLLAAWAGLGRAEEEKMPAAARQNPPDLKSELENSLGMEFVPVEGLKGMLFSKYETRVSDFRAFVKDVENNAGFNYQSWMEPFLLGSAGWKQRGWQYGWENPGFKQTDNHPATCASWEDAKAFCAWLTKKERSAGRIGQNQEYRLPSDVEWSVAVGLKESKSGSPREKDAKITDVYPWNRGKGTWPPPEGAGNYAGEESRAGASPIWDFITGYNDGYPRTAPVGSFPEVNANGLRDMGGNVWEWCEDLYEPGSNLRVLRGGAWRVPSTRQSLSAFRNLNLPEMRHDSYGFRVVLGESSR